MQPNWQQQQQLQGGYYNPQQQQQPQQTGFGLQSQPTGFPGQQRPQPTGLPSGNLSFLNAPPPTFGGGGMGGGMTPQMTGFPGGGASGLMSQQTGFGGMGGMRPQPTGFGGGMMGQPTGMMSQPTGMLGQPTGLMSQPTGMGGGLRPQPTGYQDPRLQSMMQSFMPSNLSQPFTSSGVPQFNQTPQNQPLTHTFQSLIQNPSVKTPKVPWTLTKQEKKDYDQIFRAWEKGDGFVSGETAREVFGQSGLSQDDMIKIWTLSDVDNRGKLNLPEFHVAMGLIYRALNGNEIPDKLPEEMVPPSMRDIDTTVNFMRDLLKHESSTRSTASSPGYSSASYANQSKDATAYKHDDTRSSSAYKPSSRHIDRKSVRYAGEESGAEIGDIRRQLQNTSALLDKSNSEYERKTEEDERLEQEVDDLKYRVKRLQDDIDYVSKGRRSAEKDEERRKLERELLFLMHEKLPELERRQEQREEEKRREERAGVRSRDRRNETHGRYDDRDRERDDHSWLKGSYDRDRRDSRDSYRRDDRDRDYGRRDSRDRDYDRGSRRDGSRDRSREREYRPRSPPASRTPPPAPPPAAASAPAPPAPPKPTKTPDVPNTKNMTPEERTAFIREQAQRRIQERLRALGVESSASETPVVDKSVEERLAQEKREAEEKSRSADEEQKAREQARQARLAGTSATEEPKEDVKAAPEAPKSVLKGKTGPPPPPASRAKQPPKPPAPRPAAAPPTPSAPSPAPAPPAPQSEPEDEEEAEFRRREEAIKKAKEDRRRRLEQLEREEEEERLREQKAAGRKNKSSEIAAPVPVPASPPAPPAASTAPSAGGYNPFRKPGAAAAPSPSVKSPPPPAVPSPGGFNPFFKPQTAKDASAASTPVTSPPAAPAPPPPPPAPPAPPPPAQAPIRSPPPADDGWESIHEKEAESDSDSSDDDDYAKSRDNRRNLASALFGGLSGGGSSSSPTTSRPGSAAPKPPAALKNLGGGDPSAGRGALLSAIAGGARLKKTQTVVKGGPVAGKVIGDAAPPAHINAAPIERQRSPSPPPPPPQSAAEPESNGFDEDFQPRSAHRQSVDWYAGLAADQTHPSTGYEPLEATREEAAETPAADPAEAPEIKVDEEDELADFDMTTSIRVRTLFPYEGQRDVDLSFNENMVVVAHPAKDPSSPWWYGLLVDGGQKGWFPHDYVSEMKHVKAKALYPYAGSTPEELPFAEGDELVIVDQSEDDWWKVEKAGVIFIVPASYLEAQGVDDAGSVNGEKGPTDAASNVDTGDAGHSQEAVRSQGWGGGVGTEAQSSVSLNDDPVPSPRDTPSVPPETAPRATPGASLNNSTDSFPSTVLLSPTIPTHVRPRSSTMASFTSSVDDGESSDDSVLSWWSDSDDDSDDEEGKSRKVDEEKEAERKRREEERLKLLSVAGLQLRREPPKPPVADGEGSATGGRAGEAKTRRAAPAAPKRRRRAPAVPVSDKSAGGPAGRKHTQPRDGADQYEERENDAGAPEKLDTQDAYARYEQFLAESRDRSQAPAPSPRLPTAALPGASGSRPSSAVMPDSAPLSPTASMASVGGGGGGRLSGFFSKMMHNTGSATSMAEGGRPRRSTIISGPITRVDDSGRSTPQAGEASPGLGMPTVDPELGKTWGSMVDSGILASMSDKERKRQESIFEFIATESAYNRDLQLIVQIFYAGLLDTLDEKAQTVIFANVEDILLANTAFLSDLEERQRETRLYVDRVGDVVRAHMGDMGVYTTYCVNQSQAGQLLQSLRSSDPALSSKLDGIRESNPAVRGLDLSHFLLIPMQRITRYPLLLKQIIHYTDDDQDLPLLQDALITVENIVGRINESVRESESRERLRILSEDLWIGGEGRLDLTAPTAYQGPRRLIKEGTVMKSKSGRKLTLVLCNDILVLIDSRNLYRMPIPLFECTVRPARDELGFTLKVEYRKGGDTIGLKALSARDAKEWRWLIEEARLRAVDARMATGTGGMRGF